MPAHTTPSPARVLTRRQFIHRGGAACFGLVATPAWSGAEAEVTGASGKPLRVGVIADLHHGFQPDAMQRLEAFMARVAAESPDLIVQMGDFCHPRPAGRECLRLWEQFHGPRYHVLGNHDLDHATKPQALEFLGQPAAHYTFNAGGFHFVVLDCNFLLQDGRHVDYARSNFYVAQPQRDHVSQEQIEWLRAELAAATRPTVILSHQGLDDIWDGGAVPNRAEVRAVIRAANQRARERTGAPRVVACLSGHHHLDSASVIEGVHYLQLNSASYYWAGGDRGSDGPRAVYAEPLFAFLKLDTAGKMEVQGRRGVFRSPSPAEKGHPEAARLSASISDRRLEFAVRTGG